MKEGLKLRLRELALGAGTRIRHIPLGERRGIAKKLREAFSGEGQPDAVVGVPRMIRTGGGDFLLSYRAVAAAPVGLTPQRHQEIKGAFNRWITDWKRSAASPNAKLSVDAPELVKKDFESSKLRLRELAYGRAL